ncbi:MAG: secondary thiamine-phosphate synthase enzyme YjbQ [Candidatus Obscuribacterales bacterium]|nr:secondary thiamine-phosphate synthase enzyme YjbQ [Candidatus Obscuribacterales bacterium]
MRVHSSKRSFNTQGHTDVIDITEAVNDAVAKSKIQSGTATVFVVGSTAGITTIEYEPGLVHDIKEAFERMAPKSLDYKHHERWHDDNGHSHIRASMLGPGIVIPVINGTLPLGTWQQIILIDFDTRPRLRDVHIQIIGL